MQLTSLHRGASVGGWDMGTSRVGMVKSTSVNPPFLFSVEDWCVCVCVSEREKEVQKMAVCVYQKSTWQNIKHDFHFHNLYTGVSVIIYT